MKKSALIAATAIPLVVGGLFAIGATHRASNIPGHIPAHTADCDGITVSGTKYTQGGSVDLTVGTRHAHRSFDGPTFTFILANPNRTIAEPWTIVLVSNAGDGSATYEGVIQPCASTTTSSTSPATTVAPPTTTSPTTTVAPATTASSSPQPSPSTSPAPSDTAASPPATSSTTSTPDAAAPPVRRPTASTLPATL